MDELLNLYSKLRNSDILTEEAIEVCRQLFNNSECILPNRNQLIVDWSCQKLSNFSRGKKHGEFEVDRNEAELWKLLAEVLNDPGSDQIVLRQKNVSLLFKELDEIKIFLGQNHTANEGCHVAGQRRMLHVFLCFQAISKNPNMSLALFNKLDNLELFLKGILTCVLTVMLRSEIYSAEFVEALIHLASVVLHQYITVQHQQTAQHKVFTNFCEKLLPLILVVRSILLDETFPIHSLKWMDEMASAVNAVVISGLFQKDIVSSYTCTTTPQQQQEPRTKKTKMVRTYNQLFEVLNSFASSHQGEIEVEGISITASLVCRTIASNFPFLLDNFLKVATKEDQNLDNATKFNFFIELYNAAKQITNEIKIEILSTMLIMIVEHNVYQVAEDNAMGEPIFKWFILLLEHEVLFKSRHNTFGFICLNTILKLNHKIIENSLETVLEKCFVKSEDESTHCDKARIELICKIVETYTKLQQLASLITRLTKVFNRLGDELGTIPRDVLNMFSKSFELCSFNQTLNIFQVFLNEMEEKTRSIKQHESTNLSIETTSILFVHFLNNASYNTEDPQGLDKKKATTLERHVQKLKDTIIQPLIEIFSTLTKVSQIQVGFATLILCDGLNSLIMFLHKHNLIPTANDYYVNLVWDSKGEGYIPDKSWTNLVVLKKKRLRFCLNLLVVHTVRRSLLNAIFEKEELSDLISHLHTFEAPPLTPESPFISWNFDPSCISNTNYPVAHWSLVTQCAPLLVPYCNENQLQNFAQFLVKTLILEETTADNSVTLHQVSNNILNGGELLSLLPMQTAVVKQFCKSMGEYLGHLVNEKLSGIFNWQVLDENTKFKDCSYEQEPHKINLKVAFSMAQEIFSLLNNKALTISRKQHKKKCCANLSMLTKVIKVFLHLPCHDFIPGNQIHCILSLLACDVLIGKTGLNSKGTSDQQLTAQLRCRETISTLLQALMSHGDFSVWNVLDMASFLSWIYGTIPEWIAVKTAQSKLESAFTSTSFELLRITVIHAMKSRNKVSLVAIVELTEQLVCSLADSAKNGNAEVIKHLDVLINITSACIKFVEKKVKNVSAWKAVLSIISKVVDSLGSYIKKILRQDVDSGQAEESCVQLEGKVMQLSATLTGMIGLLGETELGENMDWTKTILEWSKIVPMLVVKISKKMENLEESSSLLDVSNETITLISVLTNLLKGGGEHHNSITDAFCIEILRKCLGILSKVGFENEECGTLRNTVFGLVVVMFEQSNGRHCLSLLDGILEWSAEKSGTSNDTLVNLVTGLSVFKDLVAMNVVKRKKKELGSVIGKIMITLISRATLNIKISVLVLEIVAALITIGSGVFNPHDLSLVFQVLVLNADEPNIWLFCRIFTARFAILSWMLFYYPHYVYAAVHVFLPCVRELLHSLLIQVTKVSNTKTDSEVEALLNCASKMSRLYQEMASHKDILSKYSIYFLADCVHVMSTQGVSGMVRNMLMQGVHFLFDVCNDDSVTKLHVYLPNGERELFRSLKDDYMKHHKFKGNA